MNCGFFCDTGFIRGLCDKLDFHNSSCELFSSNYPIESYEYVVSQTVVNELNYYKYKLTKNASRNPMEKIYFNYIRLVQQYIDLYLDQMERYSCSELEKEDLNKVIICIQPIIGFDSHNQQNDIQITADAIIWSKNSNNNTNSLLTVDKKDIYRNSKKIIKESEKGLGNRLNIDFIYVPFYKEELS